MRRNTQLISKFKNQRGVTAVVVAIVISVLIGFVALAVDIGYVAATKNELQNAADAAALAGAGKLGEIYTNMTLAQQLAYDCATASSSDDCAAIRAQAKDVVGGVDGDPLKNSVAGKVDMIIRDTDITIFDLSDSAVAGDTKYGDNGEPDITKHPNAVRVRVYRVNNANGPITTFFARIFGINTVGLRADATAALNGVGETGDVNFPIGLSWTNFVEDCSVEDPVDKTGICGSEFTLNPTSESCAGWHNFTDDANAPDMKKKFFELIAEDPKEDEVCKEEPCGNAWLEKHWPSGPTGVPVEDPPTITDETPYNFSGGDNATLFNGSYLAWDVNDNTVPIMDGDDQVVLGEPRDKPAAFIALFDYFRFRDNDYEDLDGDGICDEGEERDDDSVWTARAPIYEDDCPCDNPSQSRIIKGFVTVRVTAPNPPPDKTVTATIDCNIRVINGRGGGGPYSFLLGSVPNLVE